MWVKIKTSFKEFKMLIFHLASKILPWRYDGGSKKGGQLLK